MNGKEIDRENKNFLEFKSTIDKNISKEMGEHIGRLKNWKQFLNESFEKDETFYKLVDFDILDLILKDGLKPGKDEGSWVIAEKNMSDWVKPNNLFGSMLQALLYFPAKKNSNLVLLKIVTKPTNIKVRNVDLMLKDMRKWKESIRDIGDLNEVSYSINEYLLIDKIDPSEIEVVNAFSVPIEISEFKIEPNSLLEFIFGRGSRLIKEGKINSLGLIFKFIFLKIKQKFKI